MSLGTQLVRTSVDHGTAHEIAWEGKASSKNLLSAINYAKKNDSISIIFSFII